MLPLCQVPLGHHAKMPPTPQTVFPKSVLYLGNTYSPWLRTAQKNGGAGVSPFRLCYNLMAPAAELQDSLGVSHQDHQREGIYLLTAEGTGLGGLT